MQAGITFRLDASGDRNIAYDLNHDNKMQSTEVGSILDALEPEQVTIGTTPGAAGSAREGRPRQMSCLGARPS